MPYSYDPTLEPRPVAGCVWVYLGSAAWTLVDTGDYPLIEPYTCCKSNGYADVYISSRKKIRLHRLLLNPPAEVLIDHKNGIKLDNRRENLRLCTRAENAYNAKVDKKTASGFKGVPWDKEHKRYRPQIMVNGRNIKLGSYKDPVDAAKAYDEAAVKYFGPFARLNFPKTSTGT